MTRLLIFCLAATLSAGSVRADELRVLFLGDNGHHQPRARFAQLQPILQRRGIRLDYTTAVSDLNAQTLADYDVVAVYANIDRIDKPQADALLQWVENGGGFVPIHCATYCFRNDERIVALMGGQFQSHTTGTFRTEIVAPDHPVMRGFGGFESWDETYVHHKHNPRNRTVLSVRTDDNGREPWTWVRTQGKGRVFYTAWGHDHRTWGHPGFRNLIERGIRWAAGDDPQHAGEYLADLPFPIPRMTTPSVGARPFEYVDVGPKIPNYTAGESWGTQGEAISRMQRPLPPAESVKHISVPEGFRAELFVSEPDLQGKPISMAWDERGRLWVCETVDYPNDLRPPGEGRDRIRICEDTDGDWRADKFTVFADRLSIPTAITFSRGGAIVQNGTETLFLKDTDGDDKADQRRVLFSNWTLGDTHGGVSNFQYGLDNWIRAMQGYNASSPRNARGEPTQTFRMGFFRFRPDGSKLEFIRSTNNNTWGQGISEEGLIFGSTANGNPSVFMPIPNRFYERVRGWKKSLTLPSIAESNAFHPITDKVRQVDWHGGYTAGAGHALYTAKRYPREYWNRVAFVCGPTGHLVGSFVLTPNGSGFRSANRFNLFASVDEWTAPIMAEVGPDGNVWVIDWYNYIVQHNPTPQGFTRGKGNAYESDLRDKKHGRIYRIVYGDNPAAFSLASASPSALVQALRHPNMLWRRHAQRLLVERGDSTVVPALQRLIQDRDAAGAEAAAIHALCTLQGLGVLRKHRAIATDALSHESAAVRRIAAQVLGEDGLPAAREMEAAGVFSDPEPRVRLAAFLAAASARADADAPGLPPAHVRALSDAVVAGIRDADNMSDPWLPDALTAAAAGIADVFLQEVADGTAPSESAAELLTVVAEHYARGEPKDSAATLLARMDRADDATLKAIVTGVARGWPDGSTARLTPDLEKRLEGLLPRLDAGSRGAFVRLVRGWGSSRFRAYADTIVADLLRQIDNEQLPAPARIQAARQVIRFQPDDNNTVRQLLDRVGPQTSPEMAAGLLAAAGSARAAAAPEMLIEKLSAVTPRTRRAGIAALLTRTESSRALLQAVSDGRLQLADLSLDQRQALAAHPEPALRQLAAAVFARTGGLTNPDRQRVVAEFQAVANLPGQAEAGKAVFKQHCAKCHRHGGEGVQIGPDLTGMAVHPKTELLAHILDPSASVEGNYRLYTLVTTDGQSLSGMLASESRTTVELFDSEGRRHAILREDIEDLSASPKSMMPEGFEKLVSKPQFADLLAFLTARGKYVPLDLRKAATAPSDRGMFVRRDADVERLIFPDWKPRSLHNVPFVLIDPRDGSVPNVIVLHSPNGAVSRTMPRRAEVACNGPAKAIHLLSGVAGWAFPFGGEQQTVSMIVRLHYADGTTEDHELLNGLHFADYIRRVDVEGSEFAFALRGQQIRYLAIHPQRSDPIRSVEFIKGADDTAPVVMAVTVESPAPSGEN